MEAFRAGGHPDPERAGDLMVALRDGRYTTVPVETPGQGTKRVDVPELYDPEQYRARVAHILDKPMFLY